MKMLKLVKGWFDFQIIFEGNVCIANILSEQRKRDVLVSFTNLLFYLSFLYY